MADQQIFDSKMSQETARHFRQAFFKLGPADCKVLVHEALVDQALNLVIFQSGYAATK